MEEMLARIICIEPHLFFPSASYTAFLAAFREIVVYRNNWV